MSYDTPVCCAEGAHPMRQVAMQNQSIRRATQTGTDTTATRLRRDRPSMATPAAADAAAPKNHALLADACCSVMYVEVSEPCVHWPRFSGSCGSPCCESESTGGRSSLTMTVRFALSELQSSWCMAACGPAASAVVAGSCCCTG